MLVAQRVFSMADVRLVEEAKDALKKAQRDALTKTVHPPGARPLGLKEAVGDIALRAPAPAPWSRRGPVCQAGAAYHLCSRLRTCCQKVQVNSCM